MSRIGKQPINLPEGVDVQIENDRISIRGLKGELSCLLGNRFYAEVRDRKIFTVPYARAKNEKARWGLTRSLLSNMVEGVSRGFEKKLELHGIGYRARVEGKDLVLELGFSHSVVFPAPPGIEFSVDKNVITVSGIDKQLVGQTAAQIRTKKKPEPYKAKGIRYQGEVIRRKAGKKAVASGGK